MLFANIEMFITINKFVSDLFIAINKFYKMFLFIWETYRLYLKVVALVSITAGSSSCLSSFETMSGLSIIPWISLSTSSGKNGGTIMVTEYGRGRLPSTFALMTFPLDLDLPHRPRPCVRRPARNPVLIVDMRQRKQPPAPPPRVPETLCHNSNVYYYKDSNQWVSTPIKSNKSLVMEIKTHTFSGQTASHRRKC